MSLLKWAQGKPPSEFNTYLIPVVKRQWGSLRVVADDEEGAEAIWEDMTAEEIEDSVEWSEYEYDIESCIGIEEVHE